MATTVLGLLLTSGSAENTPVALILILLFVLLYGFLRYLLPPILRVIFHAVILTIYAILPWIAYLAYYIFVTLCVLTNAAIFALNYILAMQHKRKHPDEDRINLDQWRTEIFSGLIEERPCKFFHPIKIARYHMLIEKIKGLVDISRRRVPMEVESIRNVGIQLRSSLRAPQNSFRRSTNNRQKPRGTVWVRGHKRVRNGQTEYVGGYWRRK